MKQRKRQLLAFLLTIIFAVSSFAVELKVSAEENQNIVYAYLYPNTDYYTFEATPGRDFKTSDNSDEYIAYDYYKFVWSVPSTGINNENEAWLIDMENSGIDWDDGYANAVYKPTDKKIEISQTPIKAGEDIVMSVDASDLFTESDDVTYQWYVYDEKPLAMTFESNTYWNEPVLRDGKYYFTNATWSVAPGDSVNISIMGNIDSTILDGYEINTACLFTRGDSYNYDTYVMNDYSNRLDLNSENMSFETPTLYYSRLYARKDAQPEIIPAGDFEVAVYGIQKYEKAIDGATGKNLVLSKDSPFYDTNKQYYCVVSKNYDKLSFVYPSRKVNVSSYAHELIDFSDCTITLAADSYVYTGKAIAAPVTVKNGKTTVDKSKYTVTYKNNTNVGTATVTVTAKDESGFEGSKTANFKITKAKNAVKVASKYTKTAAAKVQTIDLGAKSNFGAITYKSDNKYVTVSKSGKVTIAKNFIGTAKITVAVQGTANYAAASKIVTITVNPAKIAVGKLTNSAKGVVKVTWKANDKLSGYNIQYSTDSKFKTNVETVKISKASITEKALKGLKKNKTYFVRLRAYKTVAGKKYYSSWSTAKSITIKK